MANEAFGSSIESPQDSISQYDQALDSSIEQPEVQPNLNAQQLQTPQVEQSQEPEQIDSWQGSSYSQQQVGGMMGQELEDIPEAGVPNLDYDMGHIETIGRSLMVGFGDFFSSMGDLTDFVTGTGSKDVQKQVFGVDVDKPISTSFHEFGKYLDSYGDTVPGLKNMEEITWSDLGKLEFWETGVARMLPFALSLLIPATAAAKITSGLNVTSKLAKAAAGSKRATAAIKAASKGLGKVGLGGGIATDYAAKLALESGVKAAVGTVSAGATANLIEGMAIGGGAMNQALQEGLSPKLSATVGRQVFVDNTKSMLADIAQYALWTGQAKMGTQFLGMAKKAGVKLPGGAKMKAPSISPTIRNIAKATGMGAAQGWTDGFVEQFQEVYQDWAVQKNIAEAKGEEFSSYMDFFMSDEQRPTRVLSFATSFLMSGGKTMIDTSAESNRIVGRSMQERETTFEDLKILSLIHI